MAKGKLKLQVAPKEVMPCTVVQCWPFTITIATLVRDNQTVNVRIEVDNQEDGCQIHEWEVDKV